MAKVETQWISEMSFNSTVNNHRIVMDSDPAFGGQEKGPRPKMLVLSALGGCTGMDVVSILNKMKVSPDSFRVVAEADIADEHPKVFTKIHLTYEFKGKNLSQDKLKKAVNLSQERYCSVSAMLKKVCPFTYEIKITG
jgi:putative redox protein